jgi:hypothetical protein
VTRLSVVDERGQGMMSEAAPECRRRALLLGVRHDQCGVEERTEAVVRVFGPECRDGTWVTRTGVPREHWGIGGASPDHQVPHPPRRKHDRARQRTDD